MEPRKQPTGEEILAKLYELYADQVGVKITYRIVDKEETQCVEENPTPSL